MNYYAGRRIEIHAMESGAFFSQIYDSDTDLLIWESRMYDSLDDAYNTVKYEADTLAEVAREAAAIRRLNESGAGLSEDQHADANGVPRKN